MISAPHAKTLAITVAIVAITTAGGVIHGRFGHRWGSSEKLTRMASQLESLPDDIGQWRLEESKELAPEVEDMLRCVGRINRCYVHRQSGVRVLVSVLLGPSAPIAEHTPEICFSSRSLSIAQQRHRIALKTVGDGKDHVWGLEFRPRDGIGDRLRVYYAWSKGGEWMAPDSQRLAFIGAPWLYKIQVATYVSPDRDEDLPDAGLDFLREFVPALRPVMSDSSEKS